MATSVFRICIGGLSKAKRNCSHTFNHPFGPNNALKPAATTIVGIINGRVVNKRNKDFPQNLYFANIYAAGKPMIIVRMVESVACQNVKNNGRVITSMEEMLDPSEDVANHAILKFANKG